MSLVSNIKNISALTTVLFFLSACGGGGGSAGSTSTSSNVGANEEYTTTSTAASSSKAFQSDQVTDSSMGNGLGNVTVSIGDAVATTDGSIGGSTNSTTSAIPSDKAFQSGQVIDSSTGNGLGNVTVSIGDSATATDGDGYYALSGLTESAVATVNFEKDGYFLGSTHIQIKSLSGDNTASSNYLEYSIFAYSEAWNNGKVWTYESQNGATGGAVEVPAGTVHTDAAGNVYNGTVTARWVFKDTTTTEGRDAFPGSFKGINTNGVLVPFVSYGLTSLELENESGASLSVSEHITLILPSVTGTTQNTLPLWYYDYDQGLWIEEGYAERQSDGTYLADISHPGTWSLSQPIEEEVGIYRGHIVNEDGSPMSNVRLHAAGDNWISSDLTTDEDGMFEIEVIPGSSFQLKAYDYKNKFGANYNGTISAIASGDIVEE